MFSVNCWTSALTEHRFSSVPSNHTRWETRSQTTLFQSSVVQQTDRKWKKLTQNGAFCVFSSSGSVTEDVRASWPTGWRQSAGHVTPERLDFPFKMCAKMRQSDWFYVLLAFSWHEQSVFQKPGSKCQVSSSALTLIALLFCSNPEVVNLKWFTNSHEASSIDEVNFRSLYTPALPCLVQGHILGRPRSKHWPTLCGAGRAEPGRAAAVAPTARQHSQPSDLLQTALGVFRR